MDIQRTSHLGFYVGLGIAIIPVTITAVIACSKIIVINIIADIVVRVLTANMVSVTIYASLVKVPFLWNVSHVSAIAGGLICIVCVITGLSYQLYQRCSATQ